MPEPTPADRWVAKTDSEAQRRYLHFLQLSLVTIHATAIWRVLPVRHQPGLLSAFTVPDAIPLRTADGERLLLWATQRFQYADHDQYKGERKVSTYDYAYTVSVDDDSGVELYSWQWHPGLWSEPHVHVGRRNPAFGNLGKLHVPTGRVAFEQVLRYLIDDHGVEPNRALSRDQALDQLNESLRRFKVFRTWG